MKFPFLQIQKIPLTIYVHWPYCQSKCTYCAFNKYLIPKEGQSHERMRDSLVMELKRSIHETAIGHQFPPRQISSIYFGGGTPSLALPESISAVIQAEITLEMNPSVEFFVNDIARLKQFKDAGINRISLGIQSLHDSHLKFMGRDHSAKEALTAIEKVSNVFDRVSLDFIWGLPNQTSEQWRKDLEELLNGRFRPNHLSLYELMVENGTKLHQQVKDGRIRLPPREQVEEMAETTAQILSQFGFEHYEVSSFARNEQSKSRHNQAYWKGHDYIGIGPGAHGRVYIMNELGEIERKRVYRILEPKRWMEHCSKEGHGTAKTKVMELREILEELIVYGLRMKGVSQAEFTKHSNGILLEEFLDRENVADLMRQGFLVWEKNQDGAILSLQVTDKGFPVVDKVLAILL